MNYGIFSRIFPLTQVLLFVFLSYVVIGRHRIPLIAPFYSKRWKFCAAIIKW